jgi:demethylmenaquinone methyltransferase/2-methoxy-6-polyprenyl-1,4-benzoquinol methylase
MHRVLKPGGKVIVLEFSLPTSALVRGPYLFYFRNILPAIGGRLSGDSKAYSYLNQTVEDFPYGEAFIQKIKSAGFESVESHPVTFGIASIYVGNKR